MLLAAALSSDLPPQYQSQYRQIVDSLLDLSAVAQLQLGLNPDIDETGDATSTASDHNT